MDKPDYKGSSDYVNRALDKANAGERLTPNAEERLARPGFHPEHFSRVRAAPPGPPNSPPPPPG